MPNTLYICRGLPGSGKSTVARTLAPVVTEADQFFIRPDGNYDFSPALLGRAHADCLARTRAALAHGDCAVANTFIRAWEVKPYHDLAAELGAEVVTVNVYDGGLTDEALAERNLHGVPVETIRKMRAKWQPCTSFPGVTK
jgi:predicted kinase